MSRTYIVLPTMVGTVYWFSDIGHPGHRSDCPLPRTLQNALSVPLGEPALFLRRSLSTRTNRVTSPTVQNGALLRVVRRGRVRGPKRKGQQPKLLPLDGWLRRPYSVASSWPSRRSARLARSSWPESRASSRMPSRWTRRSSWSPGSSRGARASAISSRSAAL